MGRPQSRTMVAAVVVLVAVACGAPPFESTPVFNVTPDGGTVRLAGGAVVLNVPPNAVTQNVSITATAITGPPGATKVPGTVYSFSPSIAFAAPVQMTITYGSIALPAGVAVGELGIYEATGDSSWAKLQSSTVDTVARSVSAYFTATGTFGILGAPAALVTVTPASDLLAVGGTRTFAAEVKDAGGVTLPGRAVTWSSSLTGVATVSSAGVVTGVSEGVTTITAAVVAENQSGSATVSVGGVNVPPEGGTLTFAGGKVVLTVPAGAVSQNTAVSLVATTGPAAPTYVPGTAYVLTPAITFNTPVQLAIKYDAAALPAGVLEGELGLYTVAGGAWQKVTNSSVDVGAATASAPITGSGTFGILGAPVATVTVTPSSIALSPGATRTLAAEARDATNTVLPSRSITWSSALTSIATVSSAGVVTGVAEGSTTVTAAVVAEGKSGSASVTVGEVAVASVTISPSAAFLTVGATVQFSATTRDSVGNVLTGRPVVWTVSDPAVATVNTSGLVTGVAVGTDTLTVTAEGGVSAAAVITVQAVPGGATPAFFDNFDTGVRSDPQNGFSWGSRTGTSVSSDQAFSGTYSLRFPFGPDSLLPNDDAWAEQRFQLGAYLSEVWIEYMLYVPSNFVHRTLPNDSYNNKFLLLWRDQYGSCHGDMIIGFEYLPTRLHPRATSSTTCTVSNVPNMQLNASPFIAANGPVRPGSWSQIRIHFKAATAPLTFDGVMEMWVNGVLVMQKVDGDFAYTPTSPNTGRVTWHNGYVLGWANSGFTEETIFFVDDFKIFDTNPGW